MIIEFKAGQSSLDAALEPFLRPADRERWNKRVAQLRRDAIKSPFQAKIVLDYHWLELALSELMVEDEAQVGPRPGKKTIESLTALYFAQTIVQVYRRLSKPGRKVLLGRIQDGLKAESGLAPLYLEMSVARRLFVAGYEVEFPDMEGTEHFDLRFRRGLTEGEVECKSLSCDAGRKIHRKDFYRFMDATREMIQARACQGANEAILITLDDRLPVDTAHHEVLLGEVKRFLLDQTLRKLQGDFFVITREGHALDIANGPNPTEHDRYQAYCTRYGPNCHVSEVTTATGSSFVVMRSQKEDDTSKPLLEAMKKATTQFSGSRPAFVTVQFDDIQPADLFRLELRRRVGILSYYLFHKGGGSHLAATCFSAYRGLIASDAGIGEPSFSIPNPKAAFSLNPADYSPFLGHIPDAQFARLLGRPTPSKSISNIPFPI